MKKHATFWVVLALLLVSGIAAKQTVDIGSSPNDGTGDTLRSAFDKLNDNFLEVPFTVDTVADLVSLVPSANYANVYVRGYYSIGDGGGGMFTPTNSVTSTNLGTRIVSTTSGWSWERVINDGVYNVKHFGAKADDGTDDSAAIQAAIDKAEASGGGTVVFPNGIFTLTAALTIDSPNLCLKGEDDAEIAPSSVARAINISANNIVIDSLNFDGSGLSSPSGDWNTGNAPTGTCIYVYGTSTTNTVDNVTIRNCTSSSSPSGFILGQYVSNFKVLNCLIDGDADTPTYAPPGGIRVDNGYRCQFSGNTAINHPSISARKAIIFNNVDDGQMIGNNVYGGTGTNQNDGIYLSTCKRVSIIGNTVRSTAGNGIKLSRNNESVQIIGNGVFECTNVGIHMQGSRKIVCSKNVIEESTADPGGPGILIASHPTYSADAYDIDVTDNMIYRSGTYTSFTDQDNIGIELLGTSGLDVYRIRVSGNTVDGAYYGVVLRDPLDATQFHDIKVCNNTVRRTTNHGVILPPVDSLVFSGNTVFSPNSNYCLLLEDSFTGTAGKVTIEDNDFVNPPDHALVVQADSVCDLLEIRNNRFNATQSAARAIQINGPGITTIRINGNSALNLGSSVAIGMTGKAATTHRVWIENNEFYNKDFTVTDTSSTINLVLNNNNYDELIAKPTNGTLSGEDKEIYAQGIATTVGDGSNISHGLSFEPTIVRVTPTVAGEMVSVTAIGGVAGTFTIAVKQDDGTAGTSQTVYWEAQVYQ